MILIKSIIVLVEVWCLYVIVIILRTIYLRAFTNYGWNLDPKKNIWEAYPFKAQSLIKIVSVLAVNNSLVIIIIFLLIWIFNEYVLEINTKSLIFCRKGHDWISIGRQYVKKCRMSALKKYSFIRLKEIKKV